MRPSTAVPGMPLKGVHNLKYAQGSLQRGLCIAGWFADMVMGAGCHRGIECTGSLRHWHHTPAAAERVRHGSWSLVPWRGAARWSSDYVMLASALFTT